MPLLAGAARVDITPRLGCHLQGALTDRVSDNIHDPLYAKALVLDNGDVRLGFVVCDLIAVTGPMVARARQLAAEAAGIAPEHLLVSATHTHYGPSTMDIALVPVEREYVAEVPERIAEAVTLAARRLAPAEVGFGVGACPTEVHNRRWHLRDGTVRMNPPVMSPDLVAPAGPVDPALSVLVVRDRDRRPVAVLANLGLHYVGSRGLDISADYYGYFDRALRRCAGAEFLVIMSNGCSGDVNNVNFQRSRPTSLHDYHQAERVANVCAGEAWKVWNTLWEEDFHSEVTLGALEERVKVIPRRPTDEQLVADRAYLAEHRVEEDPVRYMYARERVLLAEEFPRSIEVPIHALRVGEIGFVGLPGEIFAAIGLAIKRRSPFPHTVCISLANDCVGYVATDRGLDQGGYETELCRWVFVPKGTEGRWIETSLRLLDRLTTA